MSIGNIVLDSAGRITQWNARSQRLFAFPQDRVAGRPFSCLIDDPELDADALLQAAASVGYADYVGDCLRADGSRFPAQVLITAVSEGGRLSGFSLVVQNMSERSRAQQQRRDDNARLTNVIQSAMDAIITVDEEQRIVFFNTAAENVFECSAADALGGFLDRFIPPRYRAVHRGHIERFSASGVTMRRMGQQTVLKGLRATGVEFPLEASISHVTIDAKKLFTVILRDVTARQIAAEQLEESNARLRALYESMHQVREAERTRIARELHDELAQWLTALKMDAVWVAARLPAEQRELGAKMDRMKSTVDTAVASVRRIAADLRPAMLDDLGLVPAIESLMEEFSERTGIAIRLDAEGRDTEVTEPHATAVYRMVQEALTNVSRHAQASSVETVLRREDGHLLVRIRDNGKGITQESLNAAKSFGVLGIRERAQTLGGGANIFSPADGGTVVEIRVPIERAGEPSAGVAE